MNTKELLATFKNIKLKTDLEAIALVALITCISVFLGAIAFICLLIIQVKRSRQSKLKSHDEDIYRHLDDIVNKIVDVEGGVR